MMHSRTIGVLGGGQLGRMIALAGIPLGFRFRFLDPSPEAPAGDVGDLIVGSFDDIGALEKFASGVDVVTYEFENVPVMAVECLASRLAVRPEATSLAGTQDRFVEKSTFDALGVPTTRYAAVHSRPEFDAAIERIGMPCVVKTRRNGYDGKGQGVIRSMADVDRVWNELGGRELLVEEFIRFDREVSIIGVRGADGACAFYPLAENVHERGILRCSRIPAAGADAPMQQHAERHARALMEKFGHIGVFTIEFFVKDARLVANEMAPRVHNSGHWTIEGAVTSQFENHVRAIAGLPLGSCEAISASAMVNIVGEWPGDAAIAEMLAMPGVHVHNYAKSPRAGRKIGHVTLVGCGEREMVRVLELCPHV